MSVSISGWRPVCARLQALADRRVTFALLALAIVLRLLTGHSQAVTGDQPRYLLYATAFIRHGYFLMSVPEWSVIARHLNVPRPICLWAPAGR